MSVSKIGIWLKAFRLRTLPLALANAVMGSLMAYADGGFRLSVFILTVITISSLQVLSNLANDYGDYKSGADNEERVGPTRVTVSGLITTTEIKRMIYAFIAISFISGSVLIFVGLNHMEWKSILLFYVLGLAAIGAAIKYTIGRNPYGYKGLGDIFVFMFFGLVGVIGTFFMHTQWFEISIIYPAVAIGLLSVGVLNINNLRDIETDRKTGKNTLAVQHGKSFTQFYHITLIAVAFLSATMYNVLEYYSHWQWLFLITTPFFVKNIMKVYKYTTSDELNNELKNLALSTFLFALTFGIGLIL